MNLTQFGRVEMDPMQVPRVSFSNEARGRGFEKMLKARDATGTGSKRQTTNSRQETPGNTSPAHTPEPGQDRSPQPVAQREPRSPEVSQPLAEPERANAPTGEEASRQVIGANQSQPDRAKRAPSNDQDPVDSAPQSAVANASPAWLALEERLRSQVREVPTKATTSITATNAASAVSAPGSKTAGALLFEKPHAGNRTERPASATPSFRSFSKQTLELAEQARDSVFKQIAFRLTPERGEMRMLLDPPELGQLDVRLSIDQGGRVSLNMLTERPELAVMLDKYMPELTRALAANGLTVEQAAVGQQNQDTRRQAQQQFIGEGDGSAHSGTVTEHDSASRLEDLARRGFYSAEGFDFWV